MSEEPKRGVTITPQGVSVVLGVLGVLAAIYTIVSTLNGYAFRITALETHANAMALSAGKISESVGRISEEVDQLSNTVGRIDERLLSIMPKDPRYGIRESDYRIDNR